MTVKYIHYLLDNETATVTNSKIRNVSFNTDASDTTGGFVVSVSETLNFDPDHIFTLNQLLLAKTAAVLEYYPGFTTSVHDDLLDATGINAGTSVGCQIGGRKTVRVLPGGQVETVAVALGSTPTQAIVTWQVFNLARTNDKTSRITVEYEDQPASELTVQASFNNGATYNTVVDGSLQTIAAPDQGSNLILRFSNSGPSVRGLSCWTVIY